MIIIYHAPRAILARMAAALHLAGGGEGPRRPEKALDLAGVGPAGRRVAGSPPEQVRALLVPRSGLQREGTDPAGARVYSAATGAAPAVVEHAFAGFACLLGVPPRAYRLVMVREPGWPLAPLLAFLARAGCGAAFSGYLRLVWPGIVRAVTGAGTPPWADTHSSPAAGGRPGWNKFSPARARAAENGLIHIYHCYGGAHTSVTAAGLHLGRLSPRAGYHEILGQPHFDRLPHAKIGEPIFMGRDTAGHPVYCIGLEAGRERLVRALEDFAGALGVPPGIVHFHDALRAANGLMRAGGFLSRRMGIAAVGRPLVTLGTWRAMPMLWHLVAPVVRKCGATHTRTTAGRVDGPDTVTDNGTRREGVTPWPVLPDPSSRPSGPGVLPPSSGSGPATG